MSDEIGTSQRPLRAAIIGAGPSGFYAAEALLRSEHKVTVDMFDRLPVPFGLVRYGVAPDHAKIKNVTKVYEKTAERPGFSFLGNVTVGKDIRVDELRNFYDVILFACGAETDRKLDIPGEDLPGSHTATEFVAWYNGHPDYRDRRFDLSRRTAVVIGQGNVAMDVCRILSKTVDELKNTDIARHALEALAESKVEEVHMIGRRGPAQAAFTPAEIREFGELAECDAVVNLNDMEINEASRKELEDPLNARCQKNFDILRQFAPLGMGKKRKKIFVDFLKSPVELTGRGRIEKVILERNQLTGDPGRQKAQGTGQKEELSCGILFRSVGYRGISIEGVPFDPRGGVIPNEQGRVKDGGPPMASLANGGNIVPGLYVTGWIKRGPSGVIGTNKPDSEETVKHIFEDMVRLAPYRRLDTNAVLELLDRQGARVVSFEGWKKIDAAEIGRGQSVGKPREKFTTVAEMLSVLQG